MSLYTGSSQEIRHKKLDLVLGGVQKEFIRFLLSSSYPLMVALTSSSSSLFGRCRMGMDRSVRLPSSALLILREAQP